MQSLISRLRNVSSRTPKAKRLRRRVSYSNVTATIAVVFALGTGGAVAAGQLVYSSNIVDGEVKTPDIATSAVTNSKVAPDAVSGSNVSDGSLRAPDLADGAVSTSKLADNSVTATKISNGEVKGSHLADGAVTNSKLAADSVDGSRVAANSLTGADIDESTLNVQQGDGNTFSDGGILQPGGQQDTARIPGVGRFWVRCTSSQYAANSVGFEPDGWPNYPSGRYTWSSIDDRRVADFGKQMTFNPIGSTEIHALHRIYLNGGTTTVGANLAIENTPGQQCEFTIQVTVTRH
jgi:hypothetical protein